MIFIRIKKYNPNQSLYLSNNVSILFFKTRGFLYADNPALCGCNFGLSDRLPTRHDTVYAKKSLSDLLQELSIILRQHATSASGCSLNPVTNFSSCRNYLAVLWPYLGSSSLTLSSAWQVSQTISIGIGMDLPQGIGIRIS